MHTYIRRLHTCVHTYIRIHIHRRYHLNQHFDTLLIDSPLSKAQSKRLRRKLKMEGTYRRILSDVFGHLTFTCLLLAISYVYRSSATYWQNQELHQLLHPQYKVCYDYQNSSLQTQEGTDLNLRINKTKN